MDAIGDVSAILKLAVEFLVVLLNVLAVYAGVKAARKMPNSKRPRPTTANRDPLKPA